MDSLDQQLQQAHKAIVRGQLDFAGRLLDKLRQTHTSKPTVWLLSAAWYQAVGETQSALDALDEAATMALGEPAIRTQVADAYVTMHAWPQALRLFRQLDPDGSLFPIQLARCEWGSGQYQNSIQRLQDFVAGNTMHAEANLSLWQCLERYGQFAESDQQRRICQRWAGQDPVTSIMENAFLVAEDKLDDAAALLQACQSQAAAPHPGILRASRLLQQLRQADTPLEQAQTSSAGPNTSVDKARNQKLDAAHQQSLSWLKSHPEVRFFGSSARLLVHALEQAVDSFSDQDWFLEFGVYHGRSLNILARTEASRTIHWHGFDSFNGLPEDWSAKEIAGSYSTGGQQPEVPDNVTLHSGWFSDTLPGFAAESSDTRLAFMHIDCDLYSSTRTVLETLKDRCRPGTVIQFDELIGYPGYAQHEWRAWQEFLEQHWSSGYRLLGSVFMGRAVAVQLT